MADLKSRLACRFGLHDFAWQIPARRYPYRPTCTRCGKEYR